MNAEHVLVDSFYSFPMSITKKFTEHPASVDETYFEHMRVAAGFSAKLFKAAWCCAVHAIMPWRHCTTGSAAVRALHEEMSAGNRGAFAEAA